MLTDLQRRVKNGHGKPMTGTKWTVVVYRSGQSPMHHFKQNYSDVLGTVRHELMRSTVGDLVDFTVTREEW